MKLFELEDGPLVNIAPDSWFTDRENSSIWLRIYRTLFVPHDRFVESVKKFLCASVADTGFLCPEADLLIGCGRINEMKVPTQTIEMYALESGQSAIKVDFNKKDLRGGNYIFLVTPYSVDGRKGDEGSTRKFLDRASGLICLHAGVNFMHNCVFEGEMQLLDGSFSVAGPVMRVPRVSHGPFLEEQNKLDIDEIAERVAILREPKRSRIGLALQLVNKAMRAPYGFFEYWTALEVVCDGKSQKIRSNLARIYKIDNVQGAGRATGFDTIAGWRHAYVHKGMQPRITDNVERYLQLMFLDLVRYEIDLEPRYHLLAIQRAERYDLSDLGLKHIAAAEATLDCRDASESEERDVE